MAMRTYRFAANISAPTHKRLDAFLQEQKDLWNAALEERISAYQKTGKTVSFYDQCKSLAELRRDCPEHRQFDAFCQRSALNRLHKAFQAFFRRIKAGETPGFPRFKSINRVKSFETSQFSIHRQGVFYQEWGKFVNMLACKAESAGGRVRKVNAAYTSKTCNKCGGVNHHMGRRERLHCIYCGHKDHRDVNAAKNMLLGDLVSQAGGASRHARSKAGTAGLLTASA